MTWEILLALLLGIIGADLSGLSRQLARWVVKKAARMFIPQPFCEAYEDEWLSHIEGLDYASPTYQLFQALTIGFLAAPKLGRTLEENMKLRSEGLKLKVIFGLIAGIFTLIGGVLQLYDALFTKSEYSIVAFLLVMVGISIDTFCQTRKQKPNGKILK
jgi:hypothetical protein